MRRAELDAAVRASKSETREALQLVYDSLNQGQQNKIVKDARVRALFALYGVDYRGDSAK
ncbi:MAG: hypothetical protein IIX69_01360 [Clostridia bacterium]|nr:hypothetical protein [Clostridia bacterium]MBQ5809029.1 hypothetical protein [Clostridia bacterium]MBR0327698.1 hypothetical protein [Clostridia bacterium]